MPDAGHSGALRASVKRFPADQELPRRPALEIARNPWATHVSPGLRPFAGKPRGHPHSSTADALEREGGFASLRSNCRLRLPHLKKTSVTYQQDACRHLVPVSLTLRRPARTLARHETSEGSESPAPICACGIAQGLPLRLRRQHVRCIRDSYRP